MPPLPSSRPRGQLASPLGIGLIEEQRLGPGRDVRQRVVDFMARTVGQLFHGGQFLLFERAGKIRFHSLDAREPATQSGQQRPGLGNRNEPPALYFAHVGEKRGRFVRDIIGQLSDCLGRPRRQTRPPGRAIVPRYDRPCGRKPDVGVGQDRPAVLPAARCRLPSRHAAGTADSR